MSEVVPVTVVMSLGVHLADHVLGGLDNGCLVVKLTTGPLVAASFAML